MKSFKIFFASLLLALSVIPLSVAANNVSDMDISVTVNDDGSAEITQVWEGDFDSGTENYIPINTGDIGISDLRVSDEDGAYRITDNWDIDASFDEKARKCGINSTNTGVELCFGISHYGHNVYTITYRVTDFIKSYTDYDGTNFMFVNPDMSTFPTDARINITLANGQPFGEENAAIWAFGYNGEVHFSNGAITAYTNRALHGSEHMIVMFRLSKGIICPTANENISFDDVKDTAFEGSDYGYDSYDSYDDYEEAGLLETVIGFLILAGVFALFIWFISLFVRRARDIKKFCAEAQYYRDTPNGGNIEMSYYLSQNFSITSEESLIIGALMLSMINKGCLEPLTAEKIGFFGKVKQSVDLRLVHEPDTAAESRLYALLRAACGDDGILQEKELENYSYNHPKRIEEIMDGAKANGEIAFINKGGFSGRAGNTIKSLSETGRNELAQVAGLKKYLEEFSLISEREIKETIIWQDYMVYAALFGIADRVIEQLRNLYPDRLPEFENYNRNIIIAAGYCHSMHSSAQRAMQQQRTEGLGGSASFGGGGGFSGGGSGGGSR